MFAGGTRRDIKGRGLSNYLGRHTFAKLIGWRIFLLGKPEEDFGRSPSQVCSPEEEQPKEARKRRCFCIISC